MGPLCRHDQDERSLNTRFSESQSLKTGTSNFILVVYWFCGTGLAGIQWDSYPGPVLRRSRLPYSRHPPVSTVPTHTRRDPLPCSSRMCEEEKEKKRKEVLTHSSWPDERTKSGLLSMGHLVGEVQSTLKIFDSSFVVRMLLVSFLPPRGLRQSILLTDLLHFRRGEHSFYPSGTRSSGP